MAILRMEHLVPREQLIPLAVVERKGNGTHPFRIDT
jgi:hypothetical protein